MVMTVEYDIYAKLPEWGYGHKTVCHSKHEFARRRWRRLLRSPRQHD
jgi:hypothetical protein